jgi:glutamate synthase domain-containing protein 3
MNKSTIELEDPDDADSIWLYDIITEFVAETGSPLGQRLLDEWDIERQQFIKVCLTRFITLFN